MKPEFGTNPSDTGMCPHENFKDSCGIRDEKSKSEEIDKKFIATEAGPVLNTSEGKIFTNEVATIAKNIDFKAVNSLILEKAYMALKNSIDSAHDTLVWAETKYKNDPKEVDYLNSLEEKLMIEQEKVRQFDKIQGKVAMNKNLSSTEITVLMGYVSGARDSLDMELNYSQGKIDPKSDEYKSNREKNKKLFASEIFLRRKLAEFKKEIERIEDPENAREKLKNIK